MLLTLPGHPHRQALVEPAELTSIPIESNDQALSLSEAPVLHRLLDRATEESLQQLV